MSNALVVIDVQNHFAVEKAADLPQKILNHINKITYDHLIFTKYQNTLDSNTYKILGITKVLQPPATDIHSLLAPLATKTNTFTKHTYSAFKAPEFVKYLKQHYIEELFLCGINIDCCVLSTAFEAFDLGYKIKILEDLCSVSSPRDDYEQSAKTIIARNLKKKPQKPAD